MSRLCLQMKWFIKSLAPAQRSLRASLCTAAIHTLVDTKHAECWLLTIRECGAIVERQRIDRRLSACALLCTCFLDQWHVGVLYLHPDNRFWLFRKYSLYLLFGRSASRCAECCLSKNTNLFKIVPKQKGNPSVWHNILLLLYKCAEFDRNVSGFCSHSVDRASWYTGLMSEE